MGRYEWRCENPRCFAVTEVIRPIRFYKQGPVRPCASCGGEDWRKLVSKTNIAVSEDHNSAFPLTIPGLEQVPRRDDNGDFVTEVVNGQILPVIDHKDVHFKNKKEQDAWLDAKGLCRMEDGKSPMLGTSEHSVYDAYDPQAPTPEAVKIASDVRFVEDPKAFVPDFDPTPAAYVDQFHPAPSASEVSS